MELSRRDFLKASGAGMGGIFLLGAFNSGIALAYFTDDEGLYRLYVCEQCKRYLKAIDLRQAQAEVLLPLERYYTLDLDAQAQEQGYSPHHNPA